MKLEIIIQRDNETILEEAANDPSNEGLSADAIAWNAGYNHQSVFAVELDIGETFQIEEGQEGIIDGFVDVAHDATEPTLNGTHKIGDVLEPGTYRFDGDQLVGHYRPFGGLAKGCSFS